MRKSWCLLLVAALSVPSFADTQAHPPAMKVLSNYDNLLFVGEFDHAAGGGVAGYYVDTTSVERTASEVSIQATQYIHDTNMGGHVVRFVQMRFYYDCSRMVFRYGKINALDANGVIVDTQDMISQELSLTDQNTVQYTIRTHVC